MKLLLFWTKCFFIRVRMSGSLLPPAGLGCALCMHGDGFRYVVVCAGTFCYGLWKSGWTNSTLFCGSLIWIHHLEVNRGTACSFNTWSRLEIKNHVIYRKVKCKTKVTLIVAATSWFCNILVLFFVHALIFQLETRKALDHPSHYSQTIHSIATHTTGELLWWSLSKIVFTSTKARGPHRGTGRCRWWEPPEKYKDSAGPTSSKPNKWGIFQ